MFILEVRCGIEAFADPSASRERLRTRVTRTLHRKSLKSLQRGLASCFKEPAAASAPTETLRLRPAAWRPLK